MKPGTAAHSYETLAPVWGLKTSTLARIVQDLRRDGLFPSGRAGRGPSDTIGASHHAAMLLATAGHEPSDAAVACRALARLQACEATQPNLPGFAGQIAPKPGTALAPGLAEIINTCAALDPDVLDDVEGALEGLRWTLHLCAEDGAAFIQWGKRGIPYRIEFIQTQPELLEDAPRRLARWTTIPFRAVTAAARVLAENAKRSAAAVRSLSASPSAATEGSENENAARPGKDEAANSNKTNALTAEPGRSAPNRNGIYPISRPLRKRQSDSGLATKAPTKKGQKSDEARRLFA